MHKKSMLELFNTATFDFEVIVEDTGEINIAKETYYGMKMEDKILAAMQKCELLSIQTGYEVFAICYPNGEIRYADCYLYIESDKVEIRSMDDQSIYTLASKSEYPFKNVVRTSSKKVRAYLNGAAANVIYFGVNYNIFTNEHYSHVIEVVDEPSPKEMEFLIRSNTDSQGAELLNFDKLEASFELYRHTRYTFDRNGVLHYHSPITPNDEFGRFDIPILTVI